MVVQTIDDARQIIIEIKDPLGIAGLIDGHLLEPPTQLSSTVVYAEVYNMLVTPANYTDKTVRMTGEYQEYIDEQTGELYHSCVIYDALACCQQGVEFVLTDGDYPEEGTPITVVGRYETYTTPYYDYFHLVDGVREK